MDGQYELMLDKETKGAYRFSTKIRDRKVSIYLSKDQFEKKPKSVTMGLKVNY